MVVSAWSEADISFSFHRAPGAAPPVGPAFTVGVSPQIYRILGKTVVCYPIIFDLSDFYMSQDVLLLIDDIKVASDTSLNGAALSRLVLSCVLTSGAPRSGRPGAAVQNGW